MKVRSSFPLARSQSFSVLSSAPRERGSAVRGNGDAGHSVGVPGEGAQLFSAGQVPELQRLVHTPRERGSAVRGNGDAVSPLSECPVKVRSSFRWPGPRASASCPHSPTARFGRPGQWRRWSPHRSAR